MFEHVLTYLLYFLTKKLRAFVLFVSGLFQNKDPDQAAQNEHGSIWIWISTTLWPEPVNSCR